MECKYFKHNNHCTALPQAVKSRATTIFKHYPLSSKDTIIKPKCCCYFYKYHKFCAYTTKTTTAATLTTRRKQNFVYGGGSTLRRKIRKTTRRKTKKRKRSRRNASLVLMNNHNNKYNSSSNNSSSNYQNKEIEIENKNSQTNCVNILGNIMATTTATIPPKTTTTYSHCSSCSDSISDSAKCKQSVNNRKTISHTFKNKNKLLSPLYGRRKSKRVCIMSSSSSSCGTTSCSGISSCKNINNYSCNCNITTNKMNLIVKNIVTLLLPTTATTTTATTTTSITSKLAHVTTETPTAFEITTLRETAAAASASTTKTTLAPLLLIAKNVRRRNFLNNDTANNFQLHAAATKEKHQTQLQLQLQHQQQQHQHQLKYLYALGKCVKITKITTKEMQQQEQQQQQHKKICRTATAPKYLPLLQQTTTTQTSQTSSLSLSSKPTKTTTGCITSPPTCYATSTLSTWCRSRKSNSNNSSLTRLIAPMARFLNELYGLIFMTLLVLSICHNNVLETSAASLKISRREIARVAGPTSASTAQIVKQAIIPSTRAESPFNQQQHPPEQILQSQPQPQVYFGQDVEHPEQHQTLEHNFKQVEEKETETEKETRNHIFQPQIQPHAIPTEKHDEYPHQQYLTTTPTTFFSHGMTLETAYNHTFQSLSIIDGDLAVAVDTSHQNLMTVEEEMLMAAAGGAPGVGSSSLSLDDFQLHDNVVGSSYDSTAFGLGGGDVLTHNPQTNSMPIFDFGMPRNITARTGHTEAVIKCRVDRLDDKSVSWIRKRDLHILTVGTATYTSDKRFQVTESKDSREWTLHVKSPQARDSGIYECQVNTEPKMSMAFQLNIIEISPDAKAVITGPADLHFKVGSAIILTCIVHQPSVKDIGPIYWYRGEYMITPFDINDNNNHKETTFSMPGYGLNEPITQTKVNALEQNHPHYQHNNGIYGADGNVADGGGNGVAIGMRTIVTDSEQIPQILTNEITQDFAQRIAMESQLGDTMKSRLRISNAQTSDTGNYTCQPTTASSASVMVHVINDENPAAMQKSRGYRFYCNKHQENMMLLLSATLVVAIISATACPIQRYM